MPSLNPSPRNPFLQLFFQQKLRQFMVIRETGPTYISSSGLKPILTLSQKGVFKQIRIEDGFMGDGFYSTNRLLQSLPDA